MVHGLLGHSDVITGVPESFQPRKPRVKRPALPVTLIPAYPGAFCTHPLRVKPVTNKMTADDGRHDGRHDGDSGEPLATATPTREALRGRRTTCFALFTRHSMMGLGWGCFRDLATEAQGQSVAVALKGQGPLTKRYPQRSTTASNKNRNNISKWGKHGMEAAAWNRIQCPKNLGSWEGNFQKDPFFATLHPRGWATCLQVKTSRKPTRLGFADEPEKRSHSLPMRSEKTHIGWQVHCKKCERCSLFIWRLQSSRDVSVCFRSPGSGKWSKILKRRSLTTYLEKKGTSAEVPVPFRHVPSSRVLGLCQSANPPTSPRPGCPAEGTLEVRAAVGHRFA